VHYPPGCFVKIQPLADAEIYHKRQIRKTAFFADFPNRRLLKRFARFNMTFWKDVFCKAVLANKGDKELVSAPS